MKCRFCGARAWKNGKQRKWKGGKRYLLQMYRCPECGKQFGEEQR